MLLDRRAPPTRPTRTFVEQLDEFRPGLALIDTDGRHFSYGDLLDRADRFSEAIGHSRQLVFVEAVNTVDAIAAYLACLRARHAVHLYNRSGRHQFGDLVDRFNPNAIISAGPSGFEVTFRHDGHLDLHPDLAVLLATSGSTGSPKFVKLSRFNLDANARSIVSYLELASSERAITTLSFSYSYGLSVVNSHLACGAALVLTDRSVTDTAFWQRFRQAGATSFAGVPHTFESLKQSGFAFDGLPTLRYATQAGGRLAPGLVKHFASLAAAQGWRFIVMYGQTEAGPRIAYLPFEYSDKHPDSIGMPVPGVRIHLLDDDGNELKDAHRPGRLVCWGPAVMMGYAERAGDLATDDTPRRLDTGDVACVNDEGLYYIAGRTARFVKPFGIRIDLDGFESRLHARVPGAGARCAGNDERIVIAVTADQQPAIDAVRGLALSMKLPDFLFQVIAVAELPRLPNGKVDYPAILSLGAPAPAVGRKERLDGRSALRLLFDRRFARQYAIELADILGVRPRGWRSVAHIYATLLSTKTVSGADTFKSLAGDSLSYVQVTAALTDYLGALPTDWPDRTVRDLEIARLAQNDQLV